MSKNPAIAAIVNYRSGIAELDQRGENDTVTLALLMGSVIMERIAKKRKPQSADELFALAVAEFRKTNGREPVWR